MFTIRMHQSYIFPQLLGECVTKLSSMKDKSYCRTTPTPEIIAEIVTLDHKLRTALDLYPELKTYIPRYIRRQWMRANIHRSIQEIKLAKKSLSSSCERDPKHISEYFGQAYISTYYSLRLWEAQSFFTDFITGPINKYLFSLSDLEVGDIILSYKTAEYLQTHPISSLISFASNSSITHASIVSELTADSMKMLTVNPSEKGLCLIDNAPEIGEVYTVLRMKEEIESKTSILSRIKSITEKIHSNSLDRSFHFSEAKLWLSCLIGFIEMGVMAIFGRIYYLPDISTLFRGIICSEIIHIIFKENDIILTPRGRFHALVGPVELFYSPSL